MSIIVWYCILQHNISRKLNLSDLENVSGVSLKCIANHCSRLQRLSLSWCEQIEDIDIVTLAASCTQLVSLSIVRVTSEPVLTKTEKMSFT